MFKVKAGSLEEYFAFDPAREADLRAIDELIRAAAPSLERWFVMGTPDGQPGMNMKMIGYGQFQYTVKSSDVPIVWPILGLALQKNYFSLYNCANREGEEPFTRAYAGRLGRAKVSVRGFITFVGPSGIDLQALTEMITAIESGLKSGELTVS
jgi:hypothetical protein